MNVGIRKGITTRGAMKMCDGRVSSKNVNKEERREEKKVI
jgi:hypothetical protein